MIRFKREYSAQFVVESGAKVTLLVFEENGKRRVVVWYTDETGYLIKKVESIKL